MPCNCDHMEPTAHEAESRRVADFILWVNKKRGEKTERWISKASKTYYGNADKVHVLTATLCRMLRDLQERDVDEFERIVYNARSSKSRKLADWWETHKAADAARIAKEKEKLEKDELRKQALSKLTKQEKEALGL